MSTRTFLTPATRDKAGEVVAVQYEETRQEYAEVVPYWSVNDAELSKLKTQVAEAEAALRHAIAKNRPGLEIQRLETTLAGLKVELDQALNPRNKERERQRTGGDRTPAPVEVGRQAATLSETVAAIATAVAAVPAVARKVRNSWDAWAADFDQRLAAKRAAEAKNTATTCCSGKYLCSKCQAKRATA